MHPLRLGIVADEIARDFRTAVRIGKRAGLRRFEVRFLESGRVPLCDDREIHEVESIAEGEGVQITAISPGLFKQTCTAQEFRNEMSTVFPPAIDLALRWKTKMIVFGFKKPDATEQNAHLFQGKMPASVVEWMTEAGERAAEQKVQMLIEPEPICWADTGIHAAELIRKTNCPELRMNYDPGNVAWLTRQDPADELSQIIDLVGHMHIKDILLDQIDDRFPVWVVAGQGGINYSRIFGQMCGRGFQGDISLESHMKLSQEGLVEFKLAVERLWQVASATATSA